MNCSGCGLPIEGTWWACMWCPRVHCRPCFWHHSRTVNHGGGQP